MKKTLIACIMIGSFLYGCITFPEYGRVEVAGEDVRVKVEFSDTDRSVIRHYYTAKRKHLPPGLAKKGKLPPGLQKQLQRRGKLPPGLDTRPLPVDLERELSPVPRGYVRIKVAGDVILLNEQTRVIVDIIHDLGP